MSIDDGDRSSASNPATFRALDSFFGGWHFPVLALCAVLAATWLSLAMLVVPADAGAMGAFAEQLRTWCFGAAPGGGISWSAVAATLFAPGMLAAFVLWTWWEPVRELARTRPRVLVAAGVASVALAGAMAASLAIVQRPVAVADLPFPAEDLRTSIPAPSFALTDQDGRSVSMDALRGRVVLLTGVYSRCNVTCPMIFAQAQRAVAEVPDDFRRDVSVVAVTLDPEHDDVARMKELAVGHSIEAPLWRMTTGEPKAVNDLLDHLGIERRRDPATGIIEHANMFVLVDAQGRIAYRLTLGDQQEKWLVSALEVLLRERRAES